MNLDLRTIRFPVGAVVSILHRATGILLFLAIPVGLRALQYSLEGPEQFDQLLQLVQRPPARLTVVILLLVLLHHLLAGLRHLAMDIDIGSTRHQGRATAWAVLLLLAAAGSALGWLWS